MITNTMKESTTKKITIDSPQYVKKTKKKFAIRCIIGFIVGGILGVTCAIGSDLLKDSLTGIAQNIIHKIPFVQVHIMPWMLLVFVIITTIIGESFIKKALYMTKNSRMCGLQAAMKLNSL